MKPLSDRLMYLKDQPVIIDIFLNRKYKKEDQTSDLNKFEVSLQDEIPTTSTDRVWSTGIMLKEKFPHHEIEWIRIYRTSDQKSYPGAVIYLSSGKFLIFRNGDNISRYNFCLLNYQTKEMYFRANQKDITDLMAILNATDEDLPVLYGWNFSGEQLDILKKRISKEKS